MSIGVIIAIVVVGLIVIGLLAALFARARSGERALRRRRNEAAAATRREAELSGVEAERADRRARVAEAEAEHHRAEARLHSERADAYEQGLADDRLGDRDREGADAPAAVDGPLGVETDAEPVAAPEHTRR